MKSNLVLCLFVACLTHASCSADTTNPVTPRTLASEIKVTENSIKSLRQSLDTLTATVIDGNNEESDWYAIMTSLAEFLKTGAKLYTESLMGAMHVGERLFDGDHGFSRTGRCNNVEVITKTYGFGTQAFFAKVEAAIAKDLICFSNMIRDISNMEARTDSNCQPTEDDVIDFIAATLKELFQLRNDGERFLKSMHTVTQKYSIDEFMTELAANEEVMNQLTRVLANR